MPALPQAAGVWETTQGRMTLRQAGSSVDGTYVQDNGRIVATMRGNVLDGIWIEDHSAQRCSRPASDGRFFWGRIRFTYAANGQFRGAWSYCDAPVGADGEWNGTRTGGGAATPAPSRPPVTSRAPAAPPAAGGGYWTFARNEVVRPTREQLGPICRLNAADAMDRGMRLDYTCQAPNDKPHNYAGNFDFTIQFPGMLKPGAKITAQGRVIARAANWSASCSVGPAYLVPSISAEAGTRPSATSSGEVTVTEPWCSATACPELEVVCALSSTHALLMKRIYRWVR